MSIKCAFDFIPTHAFACIGKYINGKEVERLITISGSFDWLRTRTLLGLQIEYPSTSNLIQDVKYIDDYPINLDKPIQFVYQDIETSKYFLGNNRSPMSDHIFLGNSDEEVLIKLAVKNLKITKSFMRTNFSYKIFFVE